MTDAEIFGKLSRIFETHAFARDEDEEDLEDLLEDFETNQIGGYAYGYGNSASSPTRTKEMYELF
jgi:hypothetical protein